MKKVFTSMALLLCASVSSVWAGDTFTVSLNGSATETRSDGSSDKYFTIAGDYNKKYTGTYNGTTYSSGLKINSSGSVTFTTTTTSTLTYVQSLSSNQDNATGLKNSTGTDLISTTDSRVADETNKVGVYTYSSLPAGTYTIYYGSKKKETGLLYVSVVYDDKAENALDNPTLTLTDSEAGTVTIGIPENASYVAYTTDGTAPSEENGTQMTSGGKITVTDGTIVKAIAIGDGTNYTNSDIETLEVSLTGFQVATPTITSWNGLVKIVSDTKDAIIYYTTDGSKPSSNSTKYTGIVYLESDATINAIATRANCTDSEVANVSVTGMPVASGVAINGASTGWEDDKNSVSLTVEDLAFTLAITGNTSKTYSAQSTVNGSTGIKLSNGATNTLTLPEGYVATKITFYSYVNGSTETASGWKEVGGTEYSEYEDFPMEATKGSYDIRTFELDNLNEITFTNKGIQLIFTIALDIEKESTEAEINGTEISKKYTTFASDQTLDFSGANVSAYIAAYNSSSNDVVLTQKDIILAGTGFVILASACAEDGSGDKVTVEGVTVSAETGDVSGNEMVRGAGSAINYSADGKYNYVLSNGKFYAVEDNTTIPTNRAYLSTTYDVEGSGAKAVNIVIAGEDATGINEVKTAANNGKIYNLQGIEVKNASNGLYIINGKKVIK